MNECVYIVQRWEGVSFGLERGGKKAAVEREEQTRASKAKKVSVLDRGKTSEMHCIVI